MKSRIPRSAFDQSLLTSAATHVEKACDWVGKKPSPIGTMSKFLRVLAVQDSEADTTTLQAELKRAGFEAVVQRVDNPETLRQALAHEKWDAVVSDSSMPGFDALAALRLVKESGIDAPFFIIIHRVEDVTEFVRLKQRGADDRNGRLNRELQAAKGCLQKATSDLEALNKELEAFSYSVSHDLRAPLRAISAFSNIMLEDFSAQLPAEAQSHLQRIATHARKMSELMEHLLDFSRLARQPLVKQKVNVAALAREVIAELRREQPGRDLQIEVGDLPDCVADQGLLKQVLVNLLSNAFKFTRNKQTARIEVSSRQEGAETVYFVKYNGAGFDMRYAEKLFGVFQRFHPEDEFEGTGVGLSIVQRLIQRHSGRIWAEAEVNKGATFYFKLPE